MSACQMCRSRRYCRGRRGVGLRAEAPLFITMTLDCDCGAACAKGDTKQTLERSLVCGRFRWGQHSGRRVGCPRQGDSKEGEWWRPLLCRQEWAVGCGPERPVEEAVRGMAAQGGQAAGRACLWLPVLLRVCVHPQGPAGLVSLLCSFQSFWLFCLSLFPCPFLPIISCRYPSNYVNL